jgi:transposase
MIGKKDLKTKIFYNFSLDKTVPEDDFYRRLDRVLDLSFLHRECKGLYGSTGNPSIDPVVFFKILIVGYLENIIYDRQLARRIKDSLSIRLFLGYDIDEETPWHSTISRTRQRIPVEIFDKVFSCILQICIEHNLVYGDHVSVDSTLTKANASMDNLERRTPEYSIEEYRDKTRLINLPDEYKDEIKSEKKGNSTHRNKRDPDSRIAKKPGNPVDLYYKDNISVDSKSGIIIHPEVTHADVNDSRTLKDIVKSSKERLKENGLDLHSVSADKAYCIGKTLKEIEELNVESYIPLVKRTINKDVWTTDKFNYNKADDCYMCPNGKKLYFQYTNGRSKRYRASYIDCKVCPYKKKCITKEQGRLVFHPVYKEQYDRLEERLKKPMAKRASKWRKIVERVFGELKNNLGTKKVNTIGLNNATKKFIMAAFTYNLKKFLKYGYKYASSPSLIEGILSYKNSQKSDGAKKYKLNLISLLFSKFAFS